MELRSVTRSVAVYDLKDSHIGRLNITIELTDDKDYIAYKTSSLLERLNR